MSLLAKWLASAPPDAAIEIAPEGVSIAVLGSRGPDPDIQAHGTARLAAGAVVPSLTSPNIPDRAAVVQALRTACEKAGHRPRRAALIIPDLAARVSLVRFDQIPARREDLDQLIRWQMKKSLPFPAEEACLTHSAGLRSGTGGEFVVVAARQETVAEYERVCEEAGIYAGLVDLSTLSVVNRYLAHLRQGSGGQAQPPAGDWLVVHMRAQCTSLAILRDENLIFFRSRPEGEEEPLIDVVHQAAMYYQDRLEGKGFARVFAGGTDTADADRARSEIEARLGIPVQPLADNAPLVGMLLRTRREAVPA